MKKIFKRKTHEAEPLVQPDLSSAIGRIQQQLTFLEKKIDTLIAQSAQKPPAQKEYAKPFRRFDNSSFREKSFNKAICAQCHAECEVPFKPTGDRPVYCKECFSKRKDAQDKPQGREDHRPGARRKPVFRKRSRDRAQ
ncbi:MAG: hypothetical protein PHP10_05605 [Candidatus Omnitrophica bacterium]|nr:hypothetical protein [Candidatus Omnitrophota bacterium]